MNAQDLLSSLILTAHAHDAYAITKKKSVRKADGKTPYSIHPIWCAMTIGHEQALTEEFREWGMQVLFFHDMLEDSRLPLPPTVSAEVRCGIIEMTFENFSREREHIWESSPAIRLLKLYDKVSNLMDGTWMSEEKRREYAEYTKELANDVEQNFFDLNIVRIARAIAN